MSVNGVRISESCNGCTNIPNCIANSTEILGFKPVKIHIPSCHHCKNLRGRALGEPCRSCRGMFGAGKCKFIQKTTV